MATERENTAHWRGVTGAGATGWELVGLRGRNRGGEPLSGLGRRVNSWRCPESRKRPALREKSP